MADAHAVYIAVYCVVVLAVLLVVLFGYHAWQQYRRTMREVLQHHHDRDLERGDAPSHRDNYWSGPPPPRLNDVCPEARPVVNSPNDKPITPLLQQARLYSVGRTSEPATTEL